MSTVTEPAVVVEPPARRGIAAIVGLGVALLGAAALVSAVYARRNEDGDLDWSVFGIGLGATAVLVLAMLIGSAGRDLGAKRALTGFPGAVGALTAGVMVGVGFQDEDWVQWAVGGVILGVAVVAFLLGRAGAPTVAAIAGLAVLYAKVVDEVVDVDDDQTLVYGGAIVLVFVVGVTAIGWLLPHRALIGVTVGAGGIVGIAGLLAFARFSASFLPTPMPVPAGPQATEGGAGDLENDIYVVLAYSAALILLWTLAAWATGSPGFRVLAVVHSAVIVPLAMTTLVVEHPTWWGVAVGAAGAVVLLLALVAGRRAHGQAAPPPQSTEPPEPFFGSPPPPPTPAEGTPASPASPATPASGTPSKSDDTIIAPANPSTPPPPPDPKDRRPS